MALWVFWYLQVGVMAQDVANEMRLLTLILLDNERSLCLFAALLFSIGVIRILCIFISLCT